jgi:putative aldouronate transport system permease protein
MDTSADRAGRRMTLGVRWRRDRVLLVLLIPGIGLLVLFNYIPLLGNVVAFQDYQPYLGIENSPWVGFENFRILFSGDPRVTNAVVNTLLISAIQIVVVFPIPIALALLLNSILSDRVKTLVQSILYLPHFLSWVIVVSIFQSMLGDAGLLNGWLRSIGASTFSFVGNPDTFLALITSQSIWRDAGWSMILFLAALAAIDPQLYEAASVDGASRARQVWHVSLPGIRGVVVLLLILRLGDVLTVGFEQLVLQQDAVGLRASEVIDTYVYNNGIVAGNWGLAAAVGLVKGVIGVVLVLGANKVAHLFGERGLYQS